MVKLLVGFLLSFSLCFGYTEISKENKIVIYSSQNSQAKLMFNISEALANNHGMQTQTKFINEKEIFEKLIKGERIDIIITESYELLQELKEAKFINFSFVSEVFFDRLVYIPLKERDMLEDNVKQEAIFFKTSHEDKDVIDNFAEKIPSVLITSNNICKRINSLRNIYVESYKYIIIKESVAKKCDLFYSGFFNNLYNVYYLAVVVNNNFYYTKKIIDLFENSFDVKSIIKNHGYTN